MAKVFVSHRGSDEKQAEQLALELRTRGHDVWLDSWRINLGDSIVARMNEGLQDAAYVIVCYSAAGETAPWMSREWMSALARQLEGYSVKILPVRLTGSGDVPAILADLKYADLVNNWSTGINELIRAIK